MELVIGIVAGAVASWLITHLYYTKGSRDQTTLYNKLTAEIRDVILADKRASLSVRELNELLSERTIDPAATGPLPYKACPRCGSTSIQHDEDAFVDGDVSDGMLVLEHYPFKIVRCTNCNWEASELDDPSHHVAPPPNNPLQLSEEPKAPKVKSGRGPLRS
jgi:predicted nucleic-acid-binding Zn-ribbon protein